MVEERFHRDDDDRPLREGRTPDEYVRPGEIEYRACPYPGSRQGGQMNVSALRQTSAHWDEIIEALAFLRSAYAAARGSYGPDCMDIWRVSQLGSALPWYFVLRGDAMPAYAAALSKATLGTGILAQRLIHRMLTERWLPPPFTTEALVSLAESTGTLVGATEVCSAPEKMIARFIDALVTGEPRGGVGRVDALIAERDRVLGFGASYAAFKLIVWLYYQARRFLFADLVAAGRTAAQGFLEASVEPPDFYIIEPPDPAAVPPPVRAAWLGELANLIVPFAPDGSDARLLDGARRLAAAMADDDANPVTRAARTFARLDAVYGDILVDVEAGLRGEPPPSVIDAGGSAAEGQRGSIDAGGVPAGGSAAEGQRGSIDAATRDRLVVTPARALFAALT